MRNGKPGPASVVGNDENGRSYLLLLGLAGAAFAIVLGATGWLVMSGEDDSRAQQPDSFFTSSYFRDGSKVYDTYEGVSARAMPPCEAGSTDNCVIDGGSFWLNGQEIRLANVDAPPLEGLCDAQVSRARDARATLSDLLDGHPIEIRGRGRDRKDRLLAEIVTPRGDVGTAMVRYKVALPWYGGKEPDTDWCASPGL